MKKIIISVIVLGGIGFAALNYHFILMDSGLKILKKSDMTLDTTFVDARGANRIKVLLNPALVKAGIKKELADAGKTFE
jgi:hypothetical protein